MGGGEVFVEVVVGVEQICFEQSFGHRLVLGKAVSAPPIVKKLIKDITANKRRRRRKEEEVNQVKWSRSVEGNPSPKWLKHYFQAH